MFLLSEVKEIMTVKNGEMTMMKECLTDYIHYSSHSVENINTGYPVRECFGRIWHWRIDLKDYGSRVARIPAFCRFPPMSDDNLATFQVGCSGEN
jgi:hypothetical protein